MLRPALLVAAACLLAGCWWTPMAVEQLRILAAREPIGDLLASPSTPEALAEQLQWALAARRFAGSRLGLDPGGAYTAYVDLGRPWAAWNLFAAPEFSLQPKTWCAPIAGCVAYRGFPDAHRARREASRLATQGYDVHVAPVVAWSTLGWFDDPVTSPMLGRGRAYLAGILFHELAHRALYVPGDTAFNESWASFVERQGLVEHLSGDPELAQRIARSARMAREFAELVAQTRERLAALYATPMPVDEMRAAKRDLLNELVARYRHWRDTAWGGDRRYDDVLAEPLGNASLLAVGLYDEFVEAFAMLFADCAQSWACLHRQAAELAAMPDAARRDRLEQLLARAAADR